MIDSSTWSDKQVLLISVVMILFLGGAIAFHISRAQELSQEEASRTVEPFQMITSGIEIPEDPLLHFFSEKPEATVFEEFLFPDERVRMSIPAHWQRASVQPLQYQEATPVLTLLHMYAQENSLSMLTLQVLRVEFTDMEEITAFLEQRMQERDILMEVDKLEQIDQGVFLLKGKYVAPADESELATEKRMVILEGYSYIISIISEEEVVKAQESTISRIFNSLEVMPK